MAKKYSLDFKTVNRESESFITVMINEKVEQNDCIGDQIGIYKEDNCLQFDVLVDLDDEDIIEFIKEYFVDYKAVMGLIRRMKN